MLLQVAPEIVGYYSGAEKITRVAREFIRPVTRVLYPRLSNLVQHTPGQAVKYIRFSLLGLGGVSGLMSLGILVFAPSIVRFVFGTEFEPAIPVLRILSSIAFITAISNVFSIQWMLPNGLDRPLVIIVLGAAILNLVLIYVLVPLWGQIGMAWAVVAAEAAMAISCFMVLLKRKLNPFQLH